MGLLWQSEDNRFSHLVELYVQDSSKNRGGIKESLIGEAQKLLVDKIGLECLLHYAPILDQYGFFVGGPWEKADKLQPRLVRGTLMAGGDMAAAEAISNLRMLAVANENYYAPSIPKELAKGYLDEVIAANLDVLYVPETEEARIKGSLVPKEIRLLFEFIAERHSSPDILAFLTDEIEKLSVQRPIITDKIEKLIASGIASTSKNQRENTKFHSFEKALMAPSQLAEQYGKNYMEALARSPENALYKEAEQLCRSMKETGIVSMFHVNLIVFAAASYKLDLVRKLLGLSKEGFKRLDKHAELVKKIIETAIKPETKQTVYSLSRLLERDIFTGNFVEILEELLNTEPCQAVERKLIAVYGDSGIPAETYLLAGTVSVLGQPLGIGQGFNPCCQSTRALSYWAQKNPVFLLELILEAVKRENIIFPFEGHLIDSSFLPVRDLDFTIPMDPVSAVLVPLLDAIYGNMIKRAGFRGGDIHKVINPEFHRQGVLSGFADKYHNGDFSSLFYRYYHPDFSNIKISGHLPQPAGIIIYSQDDSALGAHAILIQRIGKDPSGEVRVYFYNPNNDSSQTWGKTIKTSVAGKGELEGESSLLFDEFLHCLYAFHFPN
ncbi:hypothetical protein [Peribacillus glennii]|uniref:Uncharacterized protein n=1 Tax=Peribacillus glennii TaxID=2303991 RepID=A0A372LCM4_9BACI|nr:hypothetical protein [Peribacillus glennii]RFU63727.1 hypothetical protein D0466_09630 [Peribacillus glennii]